MTTPSAAVGAQGLMADRLYAAAAPLAFGAARLAARATGVPAALLRQREGDVPAAPGPLLWFHGASAGEMTAASRLAEILRHHGHRFTVAYTTTNQAGLAVAEQMAVADDVASLAPWDTPRAVARAMDAWRPRALLLVETELWPRLIFEAWRRNVPVFSVSGRIYPRDVHRYRAIRPFLRPTLERLTAILAQSETERQRFVQIGAPPARCAVVGNLKSIAPPVKVSNEALAKELGLPASTPVVVAGSFHADEMGLLIGALARVDRDDVRLMIAPRHQDGVAAAAAAATGLGWTARLRSAGWPSAGWRLLILDMIGELAAAYAMASVAVVGGGFGMHGGHNVFEPLFAGAPVAFGPRMHHFSDEAAALRRVTPEACIADAASLTALLERWLADNAIRRGVLERQRAVLPDGEVIANRYLAALSDWLPERETVPA